MKKTLKSGFEDDLNIIPIFFKIIFSVKSHTENQPPTLAILYFPGWVGLAGEDGIKANSAR